MESSIFHSISSIGILPVVKFNSAKNACQLAETLKNNGLPAIEVTFRTSCAVDAIKGINDAKIDILLGAGTVLSSSQVDDAVNSGAKFILTPGFNPTVVKYCIDNRIPIIPGCSTPSDIEKALELGLNIVKLFPAEILGGVKYIKALSGPYPNVKYIPTGGINAGNLSDYCSNDYVFACGGSWMVKDSLIDAGDFDTIGRLSSEAISVISKIKRK